MNDLCLALGQHICRKAFTLQILLSEIASSRKLIAVIECPFTVRTCRLLIARAGQEMAGFTRLSACHCSGFVCKTSVGSPVDIARPTNPSARQKKGTLSLQPEIKISGRFRVPDVRRRKMALFSGGGGSTGKPLMLNSWGLYPTPLAAGCTKIILLAEQYRIIR